jgi:ankyrin repeat protein
MKKIILLILINVLSACANHEIAKVEKNSRSNDEEKMFKEIKAIMKTDKAKFEKETKMGYTNVQGVLGESFAHNAVFLNRIDLLEIMVENNVAINLQDDFGMTPLMLAIQLDRIEIAIFLIDHMQDLNQQDFMGNTALMRAVEKGNINLIKLLMSRKVDKNIRNEAKQKAADLAFSDEIVELLK